MLVPLTAVLVVLLAALAGYAAYLTIAGRAMDNPTLVIALAAEAAIVAQLVVGVARIGDSSSQMSQPLFIAYLAGLVAVLPVAGFWGLAERHSRWGTGVILVGALGLLVMVGRLVQLWNGQG